ncbi:hypothetical protein [Pararhizobium haloflavum]|uniref:hypothetical protein n=1 Tax=Pararhizobium haloflavum TaxID=2037914 RepID=UPI000C1775B2|nr:hypothetical protein [Pararhizobium haloflavum]
MSWDRDPVLTFNDLAEDLTSPEARSARLARFAREAIDEAQTFNRSATGRDVPYEVTVDRQKGKPIDQVAPDGVVIAEFELIGAVIEWIGDELLKASPILTGRFMRSHLLFVDGVEHTPGAALPNGAAEFVFVNSQPYARKIERGQSAQAPDGVYEVIAAIAKKRFGNQAQIRFSFRSISGSKASADRQPAIIVRAR